MKQKKPNQFAKTNPVNTKNKINSNQVKKQQKQISQMFNNLTLQKKPKTKKKEEPANAQLMKEYSFINSSNNIIVFNDQNDDDKFHEQHQNFMKSQEILPEIIDAFQKNQQINLDQIQIIYQNDYQDIQSLSKFNEFLDVIIYLIQNPLDLTKEFLKKSFGILMNGIEGLMFYDEIGDDTLRSLLKVEWTEEFVLKYMLVFLRRQTKRFYFVSNSKRPIIFDFFIKSFCLLTQFQHVIIEITNCLFKYPNFRQYINQKQSLIECLSKEQKLYIQSIMANYSDIQIDRSNLIYKYKNFNITDNYIRQIKNNLVRMCSNEVLIEKDLISKEQINLINSLES